ncbi:MAG: ComEA family DNA-binding protein [Anaerolineales bacterium]
MDGPEPASLLRRSSQLFAGVLIGLLLGGVYYLLSAQPRGMPVELLPPQPLRVHVAGAVERPDVYSLPPGAILQDAIAAAGGLLAEADLSGLNLAQPLADGQRIEVPLQVESAASSEAQFVSHGSRLRLNSATAPELEQLPGVGPVLAHNIIEYREQYGPFQRIEDLLQVDGIGPAKLEGLRDLIVVP